MPAIDDLTAVRRLLDVPGPRDDVITAGRNRLDELVRREAGGVRHRRGPTLTSSRRRRRISVGAAVACGVAAAATIATTMVLPRAGSAAHPGSSPAVARPGDQRSRAGTVQQAILTAVGAVSDDIMYIKVTNSGMPKGVSPAVQFWLWPARAAVGQRVHLVMAEDGLRTEMTFTQVARFPPQVTATALSVDPATKTWKAYSGIPVPGIPLQSSLYLLDEQYMLENFVNTSKVISSHATIDGQPAIEVSYPGANGLLHFLLWVNAQTYLPLRMDKLHFMNEYPNSVQQHDFQFLPPTSANLATVTVTIPPGYKRAAS
jgi:hypothetical protein